MQMLYNALKRQIHTTSSIIFLSHMHSYYLVIRNVIIITDLSVRAVSFALALHVRFNCQFTVRPKCK